MATAKDLMGLGMGPFLANRLGGNVRVATAQGASRASALPLGGSDYVFAAIGSNGGNGVLLPPIGGDGGALIGDEFAIANVNTDTLTVYANTSNTGVNYGASNNSTAAIASNSSAIFRVITATAWLGIKSA